MGKKDLARDENFFKDEVSFFTLMSKRRDKAHCAALGIRNGKEILKIGKAHLPEGRSLTQVLPQVWEDSKTLHNPSINPPVEHRCERDWAGVDKDEGPEWNTLPDSLAMSKPQLPGDHALTKLISALPHCIHFCPACFPVCRIDFPLSVLQPSIPGKKGRDILNQWWFLP